NRDQDYRTPGLGSGVIVSREGHILTNHHVIADVDEILVTLNSGKRYQAKLVGSDARSDIAVLKIAGGASEIFPALPLGDSDEVRVGEMVFAVGNPFGLNETVTRGIISARERRLTDADNSFFQTDAVINRGSSGGPLVNLRGEVIGINVYIYSGEHGVPFWQGVGLSIPSNDVREAFDALMKGGRPSRGYLGIGVDDINPEIALVHGLNNSRGVIIEEVVADSPAADAGLQPKDVILKFDGRPVLNTSDLIPRVRARSVGSGVVLGIRRNRRDMELSAVIGERSTEVRLEAPAAADSSLSLSEILAVEVRSLNAREREARGLHPETPAIIISRVPPDSPAANSLQVGDLVHEINRQPISNPGEFTAAIDSMPLNHTSVLFVTRNGSRAFVVLEPRTGPAEGG
ncbi:MAG: trypsin-like peptidase domain-containing protein, partial [Verrucomicrobiales bacterium]